MLRFIIKTELLLITLITFFVLLTNANAQNEHHRAAWMKDAKLGVMTHYLSDWKAREYNEEMSVEKWNEMIDNFDVEGLADQMKAVGARYHIMTIGQNSGYYLAPNETYDKFVGITPSKCSRRDLISDLSDALSKRGIKLIVYLPSGAPGQDRIAREALQWQNGPHRNKEFQIKWEQIIADWSKRWGNKIVGWWFDGCYWPNQMYRTEETPNFKSFAEAARAGNPESALAFCPGVVFRTISVTPYEDYIAGEISEPEKLSIMRVYDGLVDGKQLQILSYLGERWGMGAPRFSNEQIVQWSKQIVDAGGAVTWDVPIQKNGLIKQEYIDQLKAVSGTL